MIWTFWNLVLNLYNWLIINHWEDFIFFYTYRITLLGVGFFSLSSSILEVIKFLNYCQQDRLVNSNLVSTFCSSHNHRRNRLWSVWSVCTCLCCRFDSRIWSRMDSSAIIPPMLTDLAHVQCVQLMDGRQTLTKDVGTYTAVMTYFNI